MLLPSTRTCVWLCWDALVRLCLAFALDSALSNRFICPDHAHTSAYLSSFLELSTLSPEPIVTPFPLALAPILQVATINLCLQATSITTSCLLLMFPHFLFAFDMMNTQRLSFLFLLLTCLLGCWWLTQHGGTPLHSVLYVSIDAKTAAGGMSQSAH